MSRVGMQPIDVPSSVKVALKGTLFTAEGPKGKVSTTIIDGISLNIDAGIIAVSRADDSRDLRSRHGLIRSLVANAVHGANEGFTKVLEIVGVGYKAEVKGRELHMALGYSHPVVYSIADGIDVEVEKNNRITIRGADKQKVGQVAAEIRSQRPPDAYKGKGIRYSGEILRLKVGKAGAA